MMMPCRILLKSQNWEFDGRHVRDFAMRNLRLLNFFAWRRRTFIQEAKDSTVSQLLLVSQWLFVMPAWNGGHYVNHTDDHDWQPFTDIPTDEIIFFRGVGIPPTSYGLWYANNYSIHWVSKPSYQTVWGPNIAGFLWFFVHFLGESSPCDIPSSSN